MGRQGVAGPVQRAEERPAGHEAHAPAGQDGQPRQTTNLGRIPTAITRTGRVDAAYVAGDKLYLTSGSEFVRYTLTGGTVPDVIDAGYPKRLAKPVDGIFRRDGQQCITIAQEGLLRPVS